jgi:hypothetical protein
MLIGPEIGRLPVVMHNKAYLVVTEDLRAKKTLLPRDEDGDANPQPKKRKRGRPSKVSPPKDKSLPEAPQKEVNGAAAEAEGQEEESRPNLALLVRECSVVLSQKTMWLY